jgi:hypothetical protein
MIGQLLQPDFLKDRFDEVVASLQDRTKHFASAKAEVQSLAAKEEVSAGDLNEARKVLQNTDATEFSRKEREAAWLPRNPYLCILQSALDEFYTQADAVDDTTPMGLAGDLPEVTGRSLKPDWIPTPTRGLVRQMEQYDLLGWGLSFGVAKSIKMAKGKHEFRKSASPPYKIRDKARLILCADWATGLPRARKVASKMALRLSDQGSQGRERHVIHLGDTYYAGLPFEFRERLIPHWPVEPGQAGEIGSWCLNANHDMFTGGHGYFELIDSDQRFSRQKSCSYFAFENDNWLIAALDTAWEAEGFEGDAGGLQGPQINWLLELRASRPKKRLMLLSHHQLFSLYENDSPLLMQRMGPLLNGQTPIDAWFWGHEHRCAVYNPSHNIHYPALIGHGGVPVFADSNPKPKDVLFEYKAKRPGGIIKKHAMLGFAVVDLDGESAVVRYINEEGIEHETHESSQGGNWKRR